MDKTLLLTTVVILTTLLAVGATTFAATADSYTSTGSIFSIGTGARPLGMGGAFVGLADDENAVLYNPAGIAFSEKFTVGSFYTNQYEALHYGSVNYAGKYFGLTYLQISSPNLTKTDLYGNPLGQFDYTSRGGVAAFARRINELGIGLQGKVYNRKEALGYSLSPSFLYRLRPFQLGLIFKNLLSTDIAYTEDYGEPWSKGLTVGIAYNTEYLKVDLDVDALFEERGIETQVIRVGAEGVLFDNVTLRAGLDSTLQSSVGLSLKLKDWQLDYSYQVHSDLSSTHRASVSFELNGFG